MITRNTCPAHTAHMNCHTVQTAFSGIDEPTSSLYFTESLITNGIIDILDTVVYIFISYD